MDAIKIGVIGYGYWGPNLARYFYELPGSQLIAIADQKPEQLGRAKSKYPGVTLQRITTSCSKWAWMPSSSPLLQRLILILQRTAWSTI